MIARFKGDGGKRLLIEALLGQQIIRGNAIIANQFSKTCELIEAQIGHTVIGQGGTDNDLYFILTGSVNILINGREVASRVAGQHVGEMALIDPRSKRCASVLASEETVLGKISEKDFSQIAEKYPQLWRYLAVELADRLRQRNDLVKIINEIPHLFIGSSTESLHIARAIQQCLAHDHCITRVWTDNLFGASHYPLEDLEREVQKSDFALLVINGDDTVSSRGVDNNAPRDNVIFELGLFMGSLQHQRTFIVKKRGLNIKLPSDLLGITPLEFADGNAGDIDVLIAPVCNILRRTIQTLGSK